MFELSLNESSQSGEAQKPETCCPLVVRGVTSPHAAALNEKNKEGKKTLKSIKSMENMKNINDYEKFGKKYENYEKVLKI